jgi:hypothetical protein
MPVLQRSTRQKTPRQGQKHLTLRSSLYQPTNRLAKEVLKGNNQRFNLIQTKKVRTAARSLTKED